MKFAPINNKVIKRKIVTKTKVVINLNSHKIEPMLSIDKESHNYVLVKAVGLQSSFIILNYTK